MEYTKEANNFSAREQKGREIASITGGVSRVDEHTYEVKSQTGNDVYEVLNTELGWLCSCCDHIYRGTKCKHIYAVEFSRAIRKQVVAVATAAAGVVIAAVNVSNCPACKSDNVVKHGLRRNKSGSIQRFFCNACTKWFSINYGFEGMRATPQIITSAMQLYFSGESFRNVQKFLRLQGVNVSHVAVYKWINKYIGLMQKYLGQIKPIVSDKWRADELFVKINGNLKYLFAMMDDETRFWIAAEVADTKHRHDARGLFAKSKLIAGKKPMTIVTDGLRSYHEAYKREFFTIAKPRTEHVVSVMTQGQRNNNKMERMNGEIRDREKVMRGLKKPDTVVLTGYQLYHNYVREHEGLQGKTPAEAAGIKIEGDNKWMTIIQNAAIAARGSVS